MKKTQDNLTKQRVKLSPVGGGSIIVFNTVQQGKFGEVNDQINDLVRELRREENPPDPEIFMAFGPFDNMVRFDVDDFTLVGRISSIAGVSSQQIQCAYTIKKFPQKDPGNQYWKPFYCITQLKIQNHLMLGHGPQIEEDVAGLIVEKLEEYLDELNDEGMKNSDDLEVEVMATLGWDEFFIFMRNSRGFASMFKPIVDKIRTLKISQLEKRMGMKFCSTDKSKETFSQDKHLFLSSYSTPGYCMKLNGYVEQELAEIQKKSDSNDEVIMQAKQFDLDLLLNKICSEKRITISPYFGEDIINVSTRLSIKPGHWDKVSRITGEVLKGTEWSMKEGKPVISRTFSIGRYDVYPWLDTRMTCKEFVVYFATLAFSLAGNLKKEDKYQEFLTHTQYYNSYTVISYYSSEEIKNPDPDKDLTKKEGTFISKLADLSLSQRKIKLDGSKKTKKGNTVQQAIEANPVLRNRVPYSIINGLSRIFSLFDSSIMDRFTCDSFLDMYPFMNRVREIIDNLEQSDNTDDSIRFRTEGLNPIDIRLPELWRNPLRTGDPIVRVFHSAIDRFYRGFVHRYLSSYPMMDKNETGVDFSGRLHRILSAVTGMQNLLLDDLDCHIKKGFNSISNYPNIHIYRDSYNTTEATVFHLFQIESFFTLFHESIHTFIHSVETKGKDLRDTIKEAIETLDDNEGKNYRNIIRLILEELSGDIFALKNACYNDFHLFIFWYLVMFIQSKKKVDTQIMMRFLVLSYFLDKNSKDAISKYSDDSANIIFNTAEDLKALIRKLLTDEHFPGNIKPTILSRIDSFCSVYFNTGKKRQRFNKQLNHLLSLFNAIYEILDFYLESYCYPSGNEKNAFKEICKEVPLHPPDPVAHNINKRQETSIRMFRCLLTFIFNNREKLICRGDGILNFNHKEVELRKLLFQYRIGLINTLQWEALYWKKKLLKDNNIEFPMELCNDVEPKNDRQSRD